MVFCLLAAVVAGIGVTVAVGVLITAVPPDGIDDDYYQP